MIINGGTFIGGIIQDQQADSFTLSPADITNGSAIYQNTTALGTNGADGFQNTASENWLGEGYVANGLTPGAVSRITAAMVQAGIDPNNSNGYIWNVTWGAGSSISSGLVKIGYYANGSYMYIQAIDPANPAYQESNNNSGSSLVGTFMFPATFTIYTPLTNKSNWC